MPPLAGPVEKQGAGLLFICGQEVLLLLRANTKHNLNTWGLPGGNAEHGDLSLLDTAHREASEEMGTLPEYEVTGEIRTVRGKRGQKHYTVYVAKISPAVRAAWSPTLNCEHSSFRWWPLGQAKNAALHPVVERLFDPGQYLPNLQSIVPF